ncbi:SusC/RagA family TonB-linked outer membrane protein [Tenacibaculum mesophilum]|uniref:SusC/RagA family TonB-linked outer membrane protein n=2 Tax=Tenacibaculum mesophilum TaxID=104268 RepID=A0AAE9SHD8_9FLAO|nr:SusC/RagA family TonB-linked outer membrane protein [Tenacibaculum mesophilum]KAF9660067.1 SusC/RagA family TonB-linked outer membrane protein [Tenacibaculum mesophilum]UTD16483.1 SusC/RagA family TonB-linked outer membrane protein [Tenacibaculum mesophilum]
MRTKFNGILTLFLALIVQISFAQERTISGTVSDESGPLPGVTILKKGTAQGTETDFDGNYSIQAKTGDVLVFSFVGMKTTEKTVGASNQISVVLETDNLLEEVVVVGYGTTTKKSYAGTASVVKAENIEAKSFSNVSQALAGEVSGVTVINTSGQPGSIGTVRIRGYGSPLGNRSPLYVVDGIPFAGNFDLNSINPSDIKNTTVLKDATATAIYGSRGANGVILITTKSGSNNSERSSIEVDVKTGINTQLIPRYDVLTSPEEYIGYTWEGIYNEGVIDSSTDPVAYANARLFTSVGAGNGYNMWNVADASALIDPATKTVRPGVQRLFTPEKYADLAFGTGIRQEANVRFSGGSEKSKYFASFGYLDDSGYSLNSDYRRYTTRLNLNSDVKDWLNIGVNIGYAYSESTNNGQIEGAENVFEFADKMAPIYPVYARYPNSGQLIPDPIYGGNQFDYGAPTGTTNGFDRDRPISNLLNPIGSAILDLDAFDTHALNGSFSANFKLTDKLSFETKFGGQYSIEQRNNVSNHAYGTAAGVNGNITVRNRVRWSQTFLQLLRYKTSFGDHNLEALAAHETFERRFVQDQAFKQNIVVPGLYNLNNYLEASAAASGYEVGSGIESYFGQVNYNYAGKYYFTGSLRTDGSSRFVNDKWGVFGSVGASWVVSEEDFMQDSFISYLKAKASWGVTGDQDGALNTSGFDIFNVNFIGGGAAIDLRLAGNPDLTWETTRMFQTGVELSLGNYVDANFDYYIRNTDNLFFNRRLGPSSGLSSILVNDGEVQYNGFEFDVTTHIINKENFKLDLSLNGEVLSNEMKTMPLDPSTGLPKILDSNSSEDGGYAYAQGRSIFDFYMQEWAGVDPNDGAPLWNQYYNDANNNDVLDAGEDDFSTLENGDDSTTGSLYEYRLNASNANIKKTTTKNYSNATQVFLNKSLIPDVRGAFRLSGKLSDFDFSTQFTYSLGGYAYDNTYAELMSGNNNFHVDIRNRWQNPGDQTNVPLLANDSDVVANISSASSRFITSTDFIALNNARIGYTLPNKFLGESGIDLLNIWISGDNLFNETTRRGFNPAVTETGSSARRIYAPATTLTLGVRVKF